MRLAHTDQREGGNASIELRFGMYVLFRGGLIPTGRGEGANESLRRSLKSQTGHRSKFSPRKNQNFFYDPRANCAGAKAGTARAEKINLILGERTTGGGTDLNRHCTRAREHIAQDHGRAIRNPGGPYTPQTGRDTATEGRGRQFSRATRA